MLIYQSALSSMESGTKMRVNFGDRLGLMLARELVREKLEEFTILESDPQYQQMCRQYDYDPISEGHVYLERVYWHLDLELRRN